MSCTDRTPPLDHVLEALGAERRRRVLDVLLGQSPLPLGELVARVAASEGDVRAGERTEEPPASLRVSLLHGHLPALEDAGLVEWNRDAGTVTTTDHPALGDGRLEDLLGREGDGWDDVVGCLANERRRTVLRVLAEQTGSATRTILAHELAEQERDGGPSGDAVESLEVALHHHHLPKLDDAGLVEYDVGEGTATYTGQLEREWIDGPSVATRGSGRHAAGPTGD